jgi:hypothetical protein
LHVLAFGGLGHLLLCNAHTCRQEQCIIKRNDIKESKCWAEFARSSKPLLFKDRVGPGHDISKRCHDLSLYIKQQKTELYLIFTSCCSFFFCSARMKGRRPTDVNGNAWYRSQNCKCPLNQQYQLRHIAKRSNLRGNLCCLTTGMRETVLLLDRDVHAACALPNFGRSIVSFLQSDRIPRDTSPSAATLNCKAKKRQWARNDKRHLPSAMALCWSLQAGQRVPSCPESTCGSVGRSTCAKVLGGCTSRADSLGG